MKIDLPAYTFLAVLLVTGFLSACAEKGNSPESLYQGIYNLSNKNQEMSSPESMRQQTPENTPPSYEQYRKERQKMLENQ